MKIGYCGSQGKWDRMNWNEFILYCNNNNVEIKYIDLDKSIEEQGPFDLILHKITYSMKESDLNSLNQIKNLENYIKNHPEIIFLDDLNSVSLTLDREKLNLALSSIEWPKDIKISSPKAQMLYSNDKNQIEYTIQNLKFPLLVKPKGACSTDESHHLRLVSSSKSLETAIIPSLLQEYINHGGIVYKIYTIGDHLEVGARPSTRDILPGEELILDFHSQKPNINNGLWTNPLNLSNITYPIENFQKISKILRKSLNMQLIGFDILIDHENNYWIVDVNYFPGYKNVNNLWEKFLNFFKSYFQ